MSWLKFGLLARCCNYSCSCICNRNFWDPPNCCIRNGDTEVEASHWGVFLLGENLLEEPSRLVFKDRTIGGRKVGGCNKMAWLSQGNPIIVDRYIFASPFRMFPVRFFISLIGLNIVVTRISGGNLSLGFLKMNYKTTCQMGFELFYIFRLPHSFPQQFWTRSFKWVCTCHCWWVRPAQVKADPALFRPGSGRHSPNKYCL